MVVKLKQVSAKKFVNYSNDTTEFNIKLLMRHGFSAQTASDYLNKLKISKLAENDNGCRNSDFNLELAMPTDRMKDFNKEGKK